MAKLVPEMLTPKVGNGYILVSPNSVLQMVSSAGSIVPQTGESWCGVIFVIFVLRSV